MSQVPSQQVPGLHHRRVGNIVVSALSDGYLTGTMDPLQNIDHLEAAKMLTDAYRPVPRQTSVNSFLIRHAGRAALVDCGCGDTMQPSTGKLFDSLSAAGVSPAEIDTLLLTHLHPDHSNALADRDGHALFAAAELVMHAAELAYWTDDANRLHVEPSKQGVAYFAAARAQMRPYEDRLRTFHDGIVFPGVTAVPLPGHTPGHSGYLIESGDESLLIWGDIVHVPEIQIPRPDVTMVFDVDPALATRTRRAILDRVATERQLVAGMHLAFPGYAHVARDGSGYRLVPEPWRLGF